MADFRFALLLLSILLRLALAFPNLRIPSKLLRRDERCGPGGADWGYCGSTYIDISPYYNGGGGSVDYSGIGLDYSAGLADQIAQSGRAISDLSKRSLAYGNAGGIAAKAPNEKRQMWHEVAFCCKLFSTCPDGM
ncbi:hypothetical protein BDZ91DRAFT_785490 [Kalaharituber pfeilii]|nr:hypothetical protein BDZ91DRAFT_785490 [Kalaharituber pfeilii]